jgi:hypothetical protein
MDPQRADKNRRPSRPSRASISTRTLVILLVSAGGAVLAARSAAWATGLAIAVALVAVLREFVKDDDDAA